MHNKLIGIVVAYFVLAVPAAESRGDNQYLIPPPPPTPALMVPPPPVALPYSEAYANYKAPAQVMPAHLVMAPPQQPVRMRPNLTGLSLVEAQARGFGKPGVPYNVGFGPGAALAVPYTNAPAMNTWFDSSLRWYSGHLNASEYYNSMSAQTPYFRPEAPSLVVARKLGPSRPRFKRIIANR